MPAAGAGPRRCRGSRRPRPPPGRRRAGCGRGNSSRGRPRRSSPPPGRRREVGDGREPGEELVVVRLHRRDGGLLEHHLDSQTRYGSGATPGSARQGNTGGDGRTSRGDRPPRALSVAVGRYHGGPITWFSPAWERPRRGFSGEASRGAGSVAAWRRWRGSSPSANSSSGPSARSSRAGLRLDRHHRVLAEIVGERLARACQRRSSTGRAGARPRNAAGRPPAP